MKRFADKNVADVFKAYTPALRSRLATLRELVFETAAATPGVGTLTETLKWGQPSYLTEETGSGSTVRMDRLKTGDSYALYFHCQSGLVDNFRARYRETFRYDGKRAILFDADEKLPKKALSHCIAIALTHHLRAKKRLRKA